MNSNKEYYYQIDYIDNEGYSNFITTHKNKQKAIKELDILNRANRCLNNDTKFVLDKYSIEYNEDGFPIDDTLIEENITDSVTILEHIERVKSNYYSKENIKKRNLL